jgi:hypothetical protein
VSGRPGCSPFARAAALALSAIFVLPSCFTLAVWRPGKGSSGEAFAISLAETAKAAGPPRFLCQCGPVAAGDGDRARALANVCALWQPPLEPGAWLAVEPIEHADVVARLWRDVPKQCALHVVRGENGAPPRCWFACSASNLPHPGNIPEGFVRLPGVQQRGVFPALVFVFEAECRIAPTAAPEGAPTASITLQPCGYPSLTSRLLATPPALALDRMLLVMELLTLPLWW